MKRKPEKKTKYGTIVIVSRVDQSGPAFTPNYGPNFKEDRRWHMAIYTGVFQFGPDSHELVYFSDQGYYTNDKTQWKKADSTDHWYRREGRVFVPRYDDGDVITIRYRHHRELAGRINNVQHVIPPGDFT